MNHARKPAATTSATRSSGQIQPKRGAASGGSEGGADGAGATAGAGGCRGVDGLCTGARFASLMLARARSSMAAVLAHPALGVAPNHIGSVEQGFDLTLQQTAPRAPR